MEKGITESNAGEAEMKLTMSECAKETIWAIDSSKFDKVSFVSFSRIKSGDKVVTEENPSEEWIKYFNNENVQLFVG